MDKPHWEAFELDALLAKKAQMTFPYLEFLRTRALSCGLYSLAAGAKDLQGPHDEDEIYFVLSGRATLRIADESQQIGPGSILFVPATEEHRFVEITEDVKLLVFFAAPVAG
jgi:mannose-6-phosphate isomerase-like protein (cupin superfamily)